MAVGMPICEVPTKPKGPCLVEVIPGQKDPCITCVHTYKHTHVHAHIHTHAFCVRTWLKYRDSDSSMRGWVRESAF